jgi:hypothetical protein
VIGRDVFAETVALRLKAHTNIALFGPRGTGKTSFTVKLADELAKNHGPDAAPSSMIYVNLQRASSIPAFISAVRYAMDTHPDKRIRRAARARTASVEKELKVNLGVVQGTMRGGRKGAADQDEQLLFAQLVALRGIAGRLVVVFDEFQRLNRCPGDPLTVIRDALTGAGARHVSMFFTGSIREAIDLMLRNSKAPLFQQAAEMELPEIDRAQFFDALEINFEASGKPATDAAIDHILNVTRAHAKRTQQLAWQVWEIANGPIDVTDVEAAIVPALRAAGVRDQIDLLAGEDENLGRMLDVIAAAGGTRVTSRSLLHLFGLEQASTAQRALERLERRALAKNINGQWEIVDPFVTEWLRRTTPFANSLLPSPGD